MDDKDSDTNITDKKSSLIDGLPIIGSIIIGFRTYLSTTKNIIFDKDNFKSRLVEKDNYSEAMRYFEIGVVVAFLYLVPFFVFHSQSPSKFIFVAEQLCGILFYVFCINFTLKIFKGQAVSFRKTCSVMGYLWGLLFPLNYIILTPVLFEVGPMVLNEGLGSNWADSVSRDTLLVITAVYIVGAFFFIFLWLYFILPWFSAVYSLSKKKVLISLFLGGMPAGMFIVFLLTPLFKQLEILLGAWLVAL